MQSRHAAWAALRGPILEHFIEMSPKTSRWGYRAARPLLHNSYRYINQQTTESLPKHAKPEGQTTSKIPLSSSPTKKKTVIPPFPMVPFDKQIYEMTFTCKPCKTRSSHNVSKQGYHFGSVLITCPECKNRHVISDNLGIFTDKAMTMEDLMRERGQLVKKGSLSEDGNLEFWEDGTSTPRAKYGEPN